MCKSGELLVEKTAESDACGAHSRKTSSTLERSAPLRGRGMRWLAAGIVALGLVWSDDLRLLRRWQGQQSAAIVEGEAGQEDPWQLVDDTAGFRTYVSRVSGSNLMSLRGEIVVDEHIGRLYTAFLNVNGTLDWVRFLSEVEELPPPPAKSSAAERRRLGVGGGFLFQKFKMPWPVRDREVVLQRTVQVDKQAKKMTATYHSTDHPARPVSNSAIRAIVHRTSWALTAVRGGKTAVEFETRTDPKGALPAAIVAIMQRRFPRETVAGFVKSARNEPVHKMMAKW